MGRKPKSSELVKKNITISLPAWMIKELKKIKGYNPLIEHLLLKYFIEKKD